mgnify:CR=1 FL=1
MSPLHLSDSIMTNIPSSTLMGDVGVLSLSQAWAIMISFVILIQISFYLIIQWWWNYYTSEEYREYQEELAQWKRERPILRWHKFLTIIPLVGIAASIWITLFAPKPKEPKSK